MEAESSQERCSVEEVALVVPETDDPSLPVMTFRAWFLGITSCVILVFLNTFFIYRTQPLSVSAILAQIVVLPIGKFMDATLPDKQYSVFGRTFSLNPGPFNMKEHVIVTIFANCGSFPGGADAYVTGAISIMKAYYRQSITFFCGILIVLTTQMLGYGWAGLMRKYLIYPVEMWWPSNVAQVSLLRALHEKEPKSKGLTRMQFFLLFMLAGFIYYAFPGYIFVLLTYFSWICWIWPRSVTAQQVGSGMNGLGVGAFSLDWAGISAYHGSPLVTPWSTLVNVGIGFVLFIYLVVPLCYWKFDTFDGRKFPIFSRDLFRSDGQKYDVKAVLTPEYDLNVAAYESYGKLYLNPMYAMSLGSGFARFTATITHVALFHGSDIWKQWKQTKSSLNNAKLDIHTKLMQSYKEVPQWWFLVLLAVSTVLAVITSIVYIDDLQLPWWGVLLAISIAWIITLPVGVIVATTNQLPGYDIITQLLYGYLQPGKPIANLLFKIYGRISYSHALSFLSDLKLGHYMKIPPRCMYTAQVSGTLIAGSVNLAVAWWMLEGIENICDIEVLPPDSPWRCPKFQTTFDASVIWGLIGPGRLFGPGAMYRNLVWLFLVGAVLPLPVWIMSRRFPEKKWIGLINIPVISCGFAGLPPAAPSNISSWLVTGVIFNYFVYRYRKGWWQRYNYVLSAALDAGTAFMGVFLFFVLQSQHKDLNWWGRDDFDHCPLATCPTAPGIQVKGCPVFT